GVSVGGGWWGCWGGGVGQAAVPGACCAGGWAGYRWGDGVDAVEEAGGVLDAEEGQGGDGEGEAEAFAGDWGGAGVQDGAGEDFVAQAGQGQGFAGGGGGAVVEGDVVAGGDGFALVLLDGAGGGVEAAA